MDYTNVQLSSPATVFTTALIARAKYNKVTFEQFAELIIYPAEVINDAFTYVEMKDIVGNPGAYTKRVCKTAHEHYQFELNFALSNQVLSNPHLFQPIYDSVSVSEYVPVEEVKDKKYYRTYDNPRKPYVHEVPQLDRQCEFMNAYNHPNPEKREQFRRMWQKMTGKVEFPENNSNLDLK